MMASSVDVSRASTSTRASGDASGVTESITVVSKLASSPVTLERSGDVPSDDEHPSMASAATSGRAAARCKTDPQVNLPATEQPTQPRGVRNPLETPQRAADLLHVGLMCRKNEAQTDVKGCARLSDLHDAADFIAFG